MGILDSVAKTNLQVKVEGTAEAKAQLQSLSDTEKKIAQARVEGLEAGNKGLEKWIGVLGQVGVAIGVAKVAFDAFKEYAHYTDIAATATGVSIDKLRAASHGLKTDMELLEHAAIFNKSAFKLTQDQMDTTETAMRALEERGHSSEEVWNAVSAAVTKGTTKSLEQFGVVIDKTGLAVDENGLKLDTYGQRQQALSRIMKSLGNVANEVKGEHLDAADSMDATIVKLRNYWDEAKLKLGEMVTQLGPLIDGLAKAVDQVGKLASLIPSWATGGGMGAFQAGDSSALGWVFDFFGKANGKGAVNGNTSKQITDADKRRRTAELQAQWKQYFADNGVYQNVGIGAFQDAFGGLGGKDAFGNESISVGFDSFLQKMKSDYDKAKQLGKEAGKDAAKEFLDAYLAGMAQREKDYAAQEAMKARMKVLGTTAFTGGNDIAQFDVSGLADEQQRAFIEQQTRDSRYAAWQKGGGATKQNESVLAKTFGPIESFDLYAKAFNMLGGAVSSAMNAWIDGSMSAGKAIQLFIATALKGLASQMAIEALKHGAYALGSLAFGDVAGASTHAAAAAAFGAGAIAAAIAAKEMGGSANVPAKASAASGGGAHAGSGGGGSGSGSGGGGRTVIVAYLDPWANQTGSERRRSADKMVQTVLGGAAGTDS